MKMRQLGKTGPKVSALGLGCMGMSEHYGKTDEKESLQVLQEAFDSGITFFDTADMYGKGENEKLVGKGIRSFRDKIVLATKCALEYIPEGLRVNNSPEYIKTCCEGSLMRLGVEKIDLYYLHRHASQVPIEEPMQVMLQLIKEGKIDFVGLSEVGPEILQRAKAVLGDKLVAIQSEYSIINHRAAEMILPSCRALGVSFIAFSPLARGLLSGKIVDRTTFERSEVFDFRALLPQFREAALQKNLLLVQAVQKLAREKGCTVGQIALAYLLAQGDDIIPIPGTKRLSYLRENIGALDVFLDEQDLLTIRKIIQDFYIEGARLPEEMVNFNWNG